jgi:hypothetical protein
MSDGGWAVDAHEGDLADPAVEHAPRFRALRRWDAGTDTNEQEGPRS